MYMDPSQMLAQAMASLLRAPRSLGSVGAEELQPPLSTHLQQLHQPVFQPDLRRPSKLEEPMARQA